MLVGVVGKANVGKSTFFKAATLAEVEGASLCFANPGESSRGGFPLRFNPPAKIQMDRRR
jgi:hypothetical protein